MTHPSSDDDLVARARDGSLDAFSELVRRHHPTVYRVAYRIIGDASDAEDLTQDTFERAWLGLASFRGDAAFSTWLYRIVTNLSLRQWQRRKWEFPTAELADVPDRPDQRPDASVEADQRAQAVRQAIAELPPHLRIPLVLREFADHSYEEIARATGLTTAAVRGRLHRARLNLMEAMRPWT